MDAHAFKLDLLGGPGRMKTVFPEYIITSNVNVLKGGKGGGGGGVKRNPRIIN